MERNAGDKLGPYEILSVLGKGGMGEVWKARDTRLDRVVAVKFCEKKFSSRFLREARVIASLNHPNICTLFDMGRDYLVMEYIEGNPPCGPLAPPEAVRVALGIAVALEAAHSKGITHRDLKPANILVTQSGVKLLDFGLALVKDNSGSGSGSGSAGKGAATQVTVTVTHAGAVIGTPNYMSPEQARGSLADARSDIFSFGVVLYELLSGRRPFGGDSAIEVMAAIIRDDPPRLNAPADLSAIVDRCLRKDPDNRYQHAGEVRAALERAKLEQPTAVRADDAHSIAVLPFANLTGDKEQEYFSDGLAEEILNLLAKIPGLRVIARTSSFAFRGKEQDIRKIAEALGVATILEGSVRRAGNRIRIMAQLIDAGNGSHLWSERYDRDMTDIFAIQDEIGAAISGALKLRLGPRGRKVNIEAWQNYLKGRYYFVLLTPDSLTKAKEFFQQALEIDPNYAPAYSGLATYYYVLLALGLKPSDEAYPLAKSAAEKALAIDPADDWAHTTLASMAAALDYDWKSAERHYRDIMAVEPVPPLARNSYGMNYLLPLRRVPEAIEQYRLALETDPLSMVLHFGLAVSLYNAQQYRECIEHARKALEIDPKSYFMWFAMGSAQLGAGFLREAIVSLERVVELAPWYKMGVGSLAAAYHQAGDRELGREYAKKLAGADGDTVAAAWYQTAVGDADAIFQALDGAIRQRDLFVLYIQTLPFLEPWRGDPRFQSLLERMNLA